MGSCGRPASVARSRAPAAAAPSAKALAEACCARYDFFLVARFFVAFRLADFLVAFFLADFLAAFFFLATVNPP